MTCCKHGLERLKILIVRNPFSRLESFYKMFAWENEMGDSSIHNYARDVQHPPLELKLQRKVPYTNADGETVNETWGDAVEVDHWEDFPNLVQAVVATEVNL